MHGRRTTRSRVVSSVAVVAALLVSACSDGSRPTLMDASDSSETSAPVGGDRPEGGDGAAPDPGDPDNPEGDPDSDAGAIDDEAADASESEPGAAAADGGNPYAEITEEISEAGGGIRAVISPTGVVLPVLGRTDSGYVVQTPCEFRTVVRWGQPIVGAQVVLDPGHGGDEEGAVAEDGPGGEPLTEAALNLDLARRTAAVLAERSISVVLTRNFDHRMTVEQRAIVADAIQPGAFVSIHHNTPASRPSPVPGTEVYVQDGSDESRRLGGLLYEEVFGALSEFDVEWTSRDGAGVLTVINPEGEDAYGINRYPTSTAALIEMAYLGNPKEVALLSTDDYLESSAVALADAIERFLNSQDQGTGYIDTPRSAEPSGATGGESGCVDPRLE